MQTLSLAKVYEKQGHLQDALAIYQSLLKTDPMNVEIKKAIRRIQSSGDRKLHYFIDMDKRAHFETFERWLVKSWN